jgi:UDP-N-acetyl-D-mannosaminuronate dehydrogenase
MLKPASASRDRAGLYRPAHCRDDGAHRAAAVTGMDVSQHIVDTINKGQVHIEENDLDELVQEVVAQGHLHASTRVTPADVFVIAVPTPDPGE